MSAHLERGRGQPFPGKLDRILGNLTTILKEREKREIVETSGQSRKEYEKGIVIGSEESPLKASHEDLVSDSVSNPILAGGDRRNGFK